MKSAMVKTCILFVIDRGRLVRVRSWVQLWLIEELQAVNEESLDKVDSRCPFIWSF